MKTILPLPDFKILFESVPDLYLILLPDTHFTIVGASDAYLQATMTERETIAGRGLFDVFPDNPNDPNATGVKNLSASLGRVLQHGIPDSMAIQKYDVPCSQESEKKFEERYWRPVNSPVFGPDKKIIYIIHRVEDITNVIHLEQKGIEQEARYRSLFESIDEGFCVIEMIFDEHEYPVDYRFLEISPSFEKQTGLKDAVGKRMRELAPKHERYWFEIYGKIALTGQPTRFENRAEQLHRWYDVYAFRFGEPKNRQVAILFNDITGRKNVEEANKAQRAAALNLMLDAQESEKHLSVSNEKLDQSNKELEQFAYIASHDLQEPLRKITSFINILKVDLDKNLDGDSRENMGFIVDAASRMSQLIKDLLELSRAGRKDLKLQQLDLNDVVKDVVSVLDELIQEKKAEIHYAQLPILDQASPLISQVFQNLIGNAIKFVPKDRTPRIDLSAKEDGHQWIFCVKDNGIGVEKENLDKIFEVFRRLHGRDEYPGTGIGLTICKKIVERHGGKIWAESSPGQGTSFFFTLPGLSAKMK